MNIAIRLGFTMESLWTRYGVAMGSLWGIDLATTTFLDALFPLTFGFVVEVPRYRRLVAAKALCYNRRCEGISFIESPTPNI